MGEIKKNKISARKKLIIIIVSIASIMLILIGLSLLIDFMQKDKQYQEETIDYNFYPADFNENILDDAEYAAYVSQGFIRYCDENTGMTIGIDNQSSGSYSNATQFMVDMIYDIIEGDESSYNARFSDMYYKNRAPKTNFTMQRLYDITLTYMSEEKSGDDNYTKYLYSLEYRIDQNNGTFRKDIGDGSKKQYFTITFSDGAFQIDNVSTLKIS